ncbi:MAG: hypothetical protein AB8B85_11380 [Paracoccaceae bacterium]
MPDDLAYAPVEAPRRHLADAVAEIDVLFGEGYARAHPELVASLVQASSIDAAVAAGQQAHAEALDAAYKISREMGETILKLKPRLFG